MRSEGEEFGTSPVRDRTAAALVDFQEQWLSYIFRFSRRGALHSLIGTLGGRFNRQVEIRAFERAVTDGSGTCYHSHELIFLPRFRK